MTTKLVRSGLCAFLLLTASACLPTVARADGPNCDTDPAGCIVDPCEEDPDACGDPEPDPGCDFAKSSLKLDTAKALARLKVAATRAVKRIDAQRFNGALDTQKNSVRYVHLQMDRTRPRDYLVLLVKCRATVKRLLPLAPLPVVQHAKRLRFSNILVTSTYALPNIRTDWVSPKTTRTFVARANC